MIGRPGSAVSPYGEATGTANKSYSPKSFGDGDGRVPADRELLHEAVRHRLNNLRSKVRLVKWTADEVRPVATLFPATLHCSELMCWVVPQVELRASELQTETRRQCADLMQALEARQHAMVEAVTVARQSKLNQLQVIWGATLNCEE